MRRGYSSSDRKAGDLRAPMSGAETGPLAEPPRWSVAADHAEHIWLRIGNDASGRGIWMSTSDPRRYAEWEQLRATCILADGLIEPRVTPPE